MFQPPVVAYKNTKEKLHRINAAVCLTTSTLWFNNQHFMV